MIGVIAALVFGALGLLLSSPPRRLPDEQAPLYVRHSYDRQLRIEYHQSVDKSCSPPKL